MLKLYYVRGISRTDTPYFEDKVLQDLYFSKHEVKVFSEDSFFYPPHYRNTIDLDCDDITFNSAVNYLSINYVHQVGGEKTYYYFIDKIEYVSERIIRLHITMDTIQTYMFDINWINAKVNRRLINRWNNDNTINRKYIRNNISNGIFQIKDYWDYTRVDDDDLKNCGWIAYKINKENLLGGLVQNTIVAYKDLSNRIKYYSDDTHIILVPALLFCETAPLNSPPIVINDRISIQYWIRNNTNDNYAKSGIAMSLTECKQLIHNLSERSDIIDSYYINKLNVSEQYLKVDITINSDGNRIYNIYLTLKEGTSGRIPYGFSPENYKESNGNTTQLKYVACYGVTINHEDIKYDFNFEKNTNKKINFDIKYIPQLLDENYIQLYFGERNQQASYPMSVMEKPYLYLINNVDLLTGYRNYYIQQENNTEDIYMSMITCNTKELYTLWNDYWKDYQSGHQGTLGLGMAYKIGKSSMQIISGFGRRMPVRKKWSAKGQRESRAGAESMLDTIVEQGVTNINLQHQPETLQQGNTFSNDYLSKGLNKIRFVKEVTDIDDVAKDLEGYGYQVHENYAGVNLFDTLNTRYYFNYISCEELNINLNILNDNTTIDNIKERFYDGIRLWNVDIIESVSLNIGDMYVYDNVERDYI